MQLEILFCDCLLYINYEGLIYVIWSDHPTVPDRGNYYRWMDRGSDRWIFLSCSAYLCLTVLFRGQSCPSCPIPVSLSLLSCPGCPVLVILSCVSCPGCPVLYFLFWPSCSGCSVLTSCFCNFFFSFSFSDILVSSLFVSLLSLRFLYIFPFACEIYCLLWSETSETNLLFRLLATIFPFKVSLSFALSRKHLLRSCLKSTNNPKLEGLVVF
jgi:hypothetical protein